MEKRIEDYLHLYLGSEITDGCEIAGWKGIIPGLKLTANRLGNDLFMETIKDDRMRIVLRPLSDVTADELMDLAKICYNKIYDHEPEPQNIEVVSYPSGGGLKFQEEGGKWNYGLTVDHNEVNFSVNSGFINIQQFECTRYLLSHSFDLFGLLDAGLAETK